MKYRGGCHCGRVAFEVDGDLNQVVDCNCSICTRMGSLHWFVPRDSFRLLTPEDGLATYTFGEKTIQHHFCPHCGIHPFGQGDAPTGEATVAVNARCLEDVDLSALAVQHFDGRKL